MTLNTKKILFIVNIPKFFLSHRLPLALAAKEAGYDVHVATADGAEVSTILSEGLTHHVIPFQRSGQNLISNLASLKNLIKLFKFIKPDLIHLVTIKPVIFGGIAARIVGIKHVVAAISGLGTVFIDRSVSGFFRRMLVIQLYKAALKQTHIKVIFQNHDDCSIFIKNNLIRSLDYKIIRGSGVKLSDYPFLPEPNSIVTVVMAARLLRDKGVVEFVDAARILKAEGYNLKFKLLGEPDFDNKTSISKLTIDQWKADGLVEIAGFRHDIAHQYANAHIICLPSYREGLPKSLVEAAASGRAVVTTDVPGCRDAIIPEETGILCSAKDSRSLANAIKILVDSPARRKSMGQQGRSLAEAEFAIEKIIKHHIDIYKELVDS